MHEGHRSSGVHHRFENAEQWAAVFDAPERDAWQKPEAVVDWIAPQPADVIADLGAGTGYFAVRFAARAPDGQVFANDIEPDMVRYLEQRAAREGVTNLRAVQGTSDGPGPIEHLDVAFMCDVYHHIADRPAYFRAVADRLAPGGRVVIVDFDPNAPDDAPGPPPRMRVSVEQVSREMATAGYTLQRRDDDTLPYQYMLEFAVDDSEADPPSARSVAK